MTEAWQEVLEAAREGRCFLCGRTGFVKLSQHVAMKHDMKADEVRERYGLAWSQPLCTPEYQDQAREQLGDRVAFLQGARRSPRVMRPHRSTMQAQNRAAMAEVANRPEVKAKLIARNRDPAFVALRAEGMRRSPASATQRMDALEARWRRP